MNKKAILIGIAGGTGSGKTSVAKAITQNFDRNDVALIEQDSYYHNQSELPMEIRVKTNYDHPHAMDFALMKEQMADLLNFKQVNVPAYDYNEHTRSNQTHSYHKQHIIVLDGILALYDKGLRNMMDIKLYVDAPDDIRILRRISRDISERGRTMESVIEQYQKTVRPMHLEFVEPTKQFADIIVPEGAHNKVAIDILRTKIREILQNKA